MSSFDDYKDLFSTAAAPETDTAWLDAYKPKDVETEKVTGAVTAVMDHPSGQAAALASGSRGGSADSAVPQQEIPSAPPVVPVEAAVTAVAAAPPENEDVSVPEQDQVVHDEPVPVVPSSLQHTDTQDAIQADVAEPVRGAGGTTGAAPAALPSAGFSLGGAKGQLKIVGVPEALLDGLRSHIRSAAVREEHATAAQAQEFSQKLSQKSLVIAFLMAQLDVRLEVDAATAKAVALFRAADPMMGSVLGKLDALLDIKGSQNTVLERTERKVNDVKETALTVEQSVAYLVADRVENLGKGILSASDVLLGHKSAITARDRARDETQKRRRIEQDREGRPIR